jgi:CARDB
LDLVKNTGDVLLKGSRSVPTLAPAGQSRGSAAITIPITIAQGKYYLVACVDDLKNIAEVDESNNCRVSTAQVAVRLPDFITSFVSNPPADAWPGKKFSISDTVANQGKWGVGHAILPLTIGRIRAVPRLGIAVRTQA